MNPIPPKSSRVEGACGTKRIERSFNHLSLDIGVSARPQRKESLNRHLRRMFDQLDFEGCMRVECFSLGSVI